MQQQSIMEALVYEGPRTMNMREVPQPALQDDEVLVRVVTAGICGSELGGYLGHNSLRKPPLIMGHEFAGVVERVGVAVAGYAPGDRVTANPLVVCGQCRPCRHGDTQLCKERQLLGAHRPGAFAQYVAVPERNVYRLPEGVSFAAGAFAEPLACAVHVCRLANIMAGDQVVIYGAGPIGLLNLQAALRSGAERVVVVDLNEARLEIAAELGAVAVTGLDQLDEAIEFDVAIDAVGAGATRLHSMKAVRAGGCVIFTGLHEADSTLPVNDAIRSETVMKGAFAYSADDFETALAWIGDGALQLLPWTIEAPLSEGGECFERLVTAPGKLAKILLVVGSEG